MLENVLGITDPAVVRQFGEAAMGILDWACHPMRLTMGSMFGYERTARTLRFENVRAPLDRAVMRKIAARRRDPAIDERDDVLSMLMQSSYEDGRTMSDQELRDEAVTLLMAGYETTACTVAWAIERLVRSPVHLWRLQSELRAGADERCVDPVITETLRMRPVVPVVLRRLVAPMELGGYRLPAGTLVVPCAYLLHRRPDLYPEPDRFLPERWEGRRPDTYGWLPFGGGPRRCLGASFATMTARIAVATILRSLDLNPAENDPGEQPRRRANMFVPCEGARVVGTRVVATGVRRQPARKAEERVPIDV
jgi:cytochrome P450